MGRLPVFKLLTSGIPLTPQTLYTIAVGYPPELTSKTILLKTTHCLAVKYGELRLVLTWNLYLYWKISQFRKVLCILPDEKSNHQSCSAVNLVSYRND